MAESKWAYLNELTRWNFEAVNGMLTHCQSRLELECWQHSEVEPRSVERCIKFIEHQQVKR